MNGRDEPSATVRTFARKAGLYHRILLLGQDVAKKLYGNKTIPQTFLIDKQGNIVWEHRGFDARDVGAMSGEIEKAL